MNHYQRWLPGARSPVREENIRQRGMVQQPYTFDFSSHLGQPVFVEYRTKNATRGTNPQTAIIHIKPKEKWWIVKKRISDNATKLNLFNAKQVFEGFEDGEHGNHGFYVLWCGPSSTNQDPSLPWTSIKNQQEFDSCCSMMEKRGWKDRFYAGSRRDGK
jgi:hypothetical protein